MNIPYPIRPVIGESVYSILSRLHAVSGNYSPLDTLRKWTGLRGYKPQSGLPTHLNTLARNLELDEGSDQIIQYHTHYPLYAHFIDDTRRQSLLDAMKNSGYTKSRIGLLRNDMGACDLGRYCNFCERTDIENHGIALWHREHSLPGVKVCAMHGEPLSELKSGPKFGDRQLVLPGLCVSDIPKLSTSMGNKLFYISRQVMYLIEHQSVGVIDSSVYRKLLSEYGYVTKYGHIRQKSILRKVCNWLTDIKELTGYDRLFNGLNIERNWVAELVAGSNGFHHPIKHVVLWCALGWDANDVINTCASKWIQMELSLEPVQSIELTWELLNETLSLAGSYRQAAIVLKVDVSTLMAVAESIGIEVKRRPKKISEEIRRAIMSDSILLTTREMSRKYNLSIPTINRIRRCLH